MRDEELEHYRRQATAARDQAVTRLRERLNATKPDGSPDTKARKDAARLLRNAQRFLANDAAQGGRAAEAAPTPVKHLRPVY